MTSTSSAKYTCDSQLKNKIKLFHSKCCNKKGGKKISLNNYLNLYRKIHTQHPFIKSNNLNYNTCNNILRLMLECDTLNKDQHPPTIPNLVSSNGRKKKIILKKNKNMRLMMIINYHQIWKDKEDWKEWWHENWFLIKIYLQIWKWLW